MARSTGTPNGIATWFRGIGAKSEKESTFELWAANLGEPAQQVACWTLAEAVADHAAWCETVVTLADSDMEGRGQSTRYELRHMRGDTLRQVTHLRRVLSSESVEAPALDGSTSSVLMQLQRQNERLVNAIVDREKSSASTIASMQLALRQATEIIDNQQKVMVAMAAERVEGAMPGQASGKPDFAKEMLETIAPHVAKSVIDQYMPKAIGAPGAKPAATPAKPDGGAS
jgi:hypothetical protein